MNNIRFEVWYGNNSKVAKIERFDNWNSALAFAKTCNVNRVEVFKVPAYGEIKKIWEKERG